MSDKVREALENLTRIINDLHYGRMPDEVQRAVDEATEALATLPGPREQKPVHTWTYEEIDAALYAAHGEWDYLDTTSLNELMRKHLLATPTPEQGDRE
jgi:hypothetical protein